MARRAGDEPDIVYLGVPDQLYAKLILRAFARGVPAGDLGRRILAEVLDSAEMVAAVLGDPEGVFEALGPRVKPEDDSSEDEGVGTRVRPSAGPSAGCDEGVAA